MCLIQFKEICSKAIRLDFKQSREYKNQMHFSIDGDGKSPPHFRGKKRLQSWARVRSDGTVAQTVPRNSS